MGHLWQKTMELWRRYPILWVPILIADPIEYGLRILKPILTRHLTFWIWKAFSQHSVLGGTLGPSPTGTFLVYLAISLTTILFTFIGVALYVAAALTIARTTHQLLKSESDPNPRLSILGAEDLGGVSWLSGACILVAVIVAVPSAWLLVYLRHVFKPYSVNPSSIESSLAALPACLTVVYFLTPSYLRLTARPSGNSIGNDEISIGRRFGAFTVVALLSLSAIATGGLFPTMNSASSRFLLGMILSLLVATPYIPLAIIFGLITVQSRKPLEMAQIHQASVENQLPDAPTP